MKLYHKIHKMMTALLCSFLLTGCGQAIEQTANVTATMPVQETGIIMENSSGESSGTAEKAGTSVSEKQTNRKTSIETTRVSGTGNISNASGISGTSQKDHTSASTKTTTKTNQRNNNNTSSAGTSKKNSANTAKSTTVTTVKTEPTEEITEPIIETKEITEPETEPETMPPRKTGSVWEIMDMMTLEEKIYQLFIVTPEVLTGAGTVTAAGTATQNAIASQPVAGLIYFANNLVSRSQTSSMLSNTQAYAQETGIGMFLAVDEEGGLVARCAKKLGTTQLSPMATYGNDNDWNTAYWIGETLGNDIRQFGFNLDFAPVADVNLNSGNELGTRIFSSDPDVVGNMVSGVVQGLQSTGVAATLKHFPGLGAENGNAHYDDKIIIDRTLDDLRNAEFIPFQYGINAGADFVMVSHQIITGAGDGLPACLSPVICTDLLRNELGFDGILVTDAFNMNTISGSYSPADSAVMAIQAGVDIILMPTDLTASVQGIENAVYNGWISEDRINQSVERILLEKEKMNLLG